MGIRTRRAKQDNKPDQINDKSNMVWPSLTIYICDISAWHQSKNGENNLKVGGVMVKKSRRAYSSTLFSRKLVLI